MIWNSISGDESLNLWKQLRKDIAEFTLHQQLKEIAKFCFSMPIGYRSLDYYSSEDWPTPWEILYHGSYCTSSISLLMYYTLIMVAPDSNIELILVEDADGIYLLPLVDYHFVLNYELGQVSKYSEVENKLTVLKTYTRNQIKPIK